MEQFLREIAPRVKQIVNENLHRVQLTGASCQPTQVMTIGSIDSNLPATMLMVYEMIICEEI